MRLSFIIFLLSFHFIQGQDLQEYQWKNRVILLFKDDENPRTYEKQLELLNSDKKGLQERDIVVISPKEDEKYRLLDYLSIDKTFHGLILLGKDGGVKLRENQIVSIQRLYDFIDSMPMRKVEMRRRKKNPN